MARTAEQHTRTSTAETSRAPLVIATRHGTIIALDPRTGAHLWHWVAEPRLGMLAHGGDAVYVVTVDPLPIERIEGQEGPPSWLAMSARRGPVRRILAFHATLTALRTWDGTILWQRTGWHPFHRASVLLDWDVLVADALASKVGEAAVTALDPETGDVRWRHDTGTPWGITERLLAASGGRVLVREEGEMRRLCALDGHSGSVLWSREERDIATQFSYGGGRLPHADPARIASVLDGRDGSAAATHQAAGISLGFTDTGTVVVAVGPDWRPQIAALRTDDGTEVWRADAGRPLYLRLTGGRLLSVRLTEPKPRAEVTALDALTGRRLWRWHSPAHLLSLLKLWGLRLPQVILAAIAQARADARRLPKSQRWRIIWRELLHGQWRRPTQLTGTIQAAADDHRVHVGTSLGLFALDAATGRLLWHALPTYDVGCYEPVVAPASAIP